MKQALLSLVLGFAAVPAYAYPLKCECDTTYGLLLPKTHSFEAELGPETVFTITPCTYRETQLQFVAHEDLIALTAYTPETSTTSAHVLISRFQPEGPMPDAFSLDLQDGQISYRVRCKKK